MADELISREAVIKMLRGEAVAKYPMSFYMGLLAAADEINKLPAVDAVVLPCKVGTSVFVTDIIVGRIVECEVECFGDFDGSDEMTVEYRLPKEIPNIVSQIASCNEFGKTIFLTREEAEKALEGREDNATDWC